MGARKMPPSSAGAAMNQQELARVKNYTQSLRSRYAAQNDELFQTLINSGQKPYFSAYEPEALTASMSNQQTTEPTNFAPLGAFGPLKMFDQGRFGGG
jgi:hypothetical protein